MIDHRVSQYLRAIAALALEVAEHPELLPLFVRIIALVPQTVAELSRDRRRIAA